MIKAVFFDVGGVLVKGNAEDTWREVSKQLNLEYQEFVELKDSYKKDLVCGRMSLEDLSKKVSGQFGINSEYPDAWKTAYLKAAELNPEVYSLSKLLSKRYLVGIISNSTDLFTQINRERNLYEIFNPVILSNEVGYSKPDKKIFELALENAKLNPEECTYIDDREILLETPNKMGFHTVRYKSYPQLEKELKKLKLVF